MQSLIALITRKENIFSSKASDGMYVDKNSKLFFKTMLFHIVLFVSITVLMERHRAKQVL